MDTVTAVNVLIKITNALEEAKAELIKRNGHIANDDGVRTDGVNWGKVNAQVEAARAQVEVNELATAVNVILRYL